MEFLRSSAKVRDHIAMLLSSNGRNNLYATSERASQFSTCKARQSHTVAGQPSFMSLSRLVCDT